MIKIMTPGPTQVRENVRIARSKEVTNPDLDLTFYDFYKETCEEISSLLHTKNPVYILSGEGILGIEAACSSLTEKNDRILVIDNGIFGKGFADFVHLYGGEAVVYKDDYTRPINLKKLQEFLKKDSNFKYATLVHCDTPSGVLNDIHSICNLLHDYGILTVVDAVSSMFGEKINVDDSHIDILCGGSQKALSAAVGLTMLIVSNNAIRYMESRKTPIASFYANILTFKNYYENKWFPYTMPISDIYGLREAINNVKEDKNIIERHATIANATRFAIVTCGLHLYLNDGYSNTVTVIQVPMNVNAKEILNIMQKKYNIMIAGCFDYLEGKVIRIGHMGENANIEDMTLTLEALANTFLELGYPLKHNIKDAFLQKINELNT